MRRRTGSWPRWIAALAIVAVCGCAPKSELRGVQGAISFDDQLLASGTIEFTPVAGTKGALAGAAIAEGRYSVPQDRGVHTGGKYKVSIISMKKTGSTVPGFSDKDGKPLDEYANFIPKEYGSNSKIEVKISDEWVNKFDFHLKKDGVWNVEGSGEAQK